VGTVWLIIVVAVLLGGLYWLKRYADRIEGDSEGMVEPGARQPYGQWVWTVIRRSGGD
jgi:high-affinity Fe2+/Pb2+ permease